MSNYQRFTVATGANIGEPGPLPAELVGLAQVSLDDLSAALDPDACEALGYTGQGFSYVDPEPEPPTVPAAVTQLQFRRALRHFGIYDAVIGYVATQDALVQEAFEFASEIRRNSPSLNTAAPALAGGEAEGQALLDQLFTYAATVIE